MKNSDQKQLLLWLNDSAFKPVSRSIVQKYAQYCGKRIGLVYIGGYPKSGTTWISKMVAYYIGLPWVGHTYLQFGFPTVIHHHWDYHPAFDHSIFVLRDGRDVMVSIYMNMVVKGYQQTEKSLSDLHTTSPGRFVRQHYGRHANLHRRFRYLYGSKFDPNDVVANLPKFIESEMTKPLIPEVKSPWPEYISTWRERSGHVSSVRYEDMLSDPVPVFRDLVGSFGMQPLVEDINYIVKRFSFSRMTGRKPGEENRKSFARKGIAGDWLNHFSLEARQVFDHYAGDVLIDLGYETNHDWVQAPSVEPIALSAT